MKALLERAERLAGAAQKRQIERFASVLRELAPDATVTTGASAATISARGLGRRWLTEPLLRFAGFGR